MRRSRMAYYGPSISRSVLMRMGGRISAPRHGRTEFLIAAPGAECDCRKLKRLAAIAHQHARRPLPTSIWQNPTRTRGLARASVGTTKDAVRPQKESLMLRK